MKYKNPKIKKSLLRMNQPEIVKILKLITMKKLKFHLRVKMMSQFKKTRLKVKKKINLMKKRRNYVRKPKTMTNACKKNWTRNLRHFFII